jgi:hypothetical protein
MFGAFDYSTIAQLGASVLADFQDLLAFAASAWAAALLLRLALNVLGIRRQKVEDKTS